MFETVPIIKPVLMIIEDATLSETVAYPRSPARARRRARKGYRQHHITVPFTEYIYVEAEGIVICHPTAAVELRTYLRSLGVICV